jgi:hypothetical protein
VVVSCLASSLFNLWTQGARSLGATAQSVEYNDHRKETIPKGGVGVMACGLAPANREEGKVGDALIASDGHDAYLVDKVFS